MENIKYENLTLSLDEETNSYTITRCEKDAVSVNIPKYINNIHIRKIDDYAFKKCTNLVTVTFPEYIIDEVAEDTALKEIGEYAFSGCTSLIEVDLPVTVWTIRQGAFHNCNSLIKCNFSSMAFVGSYAFYGCKSLIDLSYFSNAMEGVCSGCASLTYLPLQKSSSIISEDAFEGCKSLTEITIFKGIDTIEKLAFRSCRNLKKVTFENPNNWYWHSIYKRSDYPLDVSNPEENAKMLSTMDFDDGVGNIFRK